jgi:hypothetical protein
MVPEIRPMRPRKSSPKALAKQENEATEAQLAATAVAKAQFKPVTEALTARVGQLLAALHEQTHQNEILKADLTRQNETLRADLVSQMEVLKAEMQRQSTPNCQASTP